VTELIKESGLQIDTPGPLYKDEELAPYFEKATVAVAPHSIGLLALDAIRHGVPVVYPINPVNGPEFESLTLGTNAISFSDLTAEGLADAVEQWLALAPQIDQDEFEAETREAVKDWTPEQVADRIIEGISSSL
jgi:glycosyltransferase involved in cell wall biosynthesis